MEKFVVLYEEFSSIGTSEYEVVKEVPTELKEGWVAQEVEVEKTEKENVFVIMDESEHYHHGVVSVKLTKESVEELIQIVKQFDGYNSEQLRDILIKIRDGHEVVTTDNVYF